MASRLDPLNINDPPRTNPFTMPSTIDLGNPTGMGTTVRNGVGHTENPDGSLTLDFSPKKETSGKPKWFGNLAEEIDEGELARIASELMEGIQNDDDSRRDWLETRSRGISLLGLKLHEPTGEVSAEGVSRVQHPLLLEAVLRFQANARGELLPAAGPLKIRNDSPVAPRELTQPPVPPMPPPPPPQLGQGSPPQGGPGALPPPPPGGAPVGGGGPSPPPAGPPGGRPLPPAQPPGGMPPPGMPAQGMPPGGQPPPPPPPTGMMAPPKPAIPGAMTMQSDELSEALENSLNHWLTAIATEYYPDTDRMLFWIGAGGQGIKKVYNCPIKRRPVSQSIDAEDLIVSNAENDLENCGRITHRIKMSPAYLKRMQLVGAYREDMELRPTQYPIEDPVTEKKKEIDGITKTIQRPQDADHEIYECYCELDIAGFEHKSKSGKITGLQLPYVVTIHKESRKVLALRRNWDEGDKMCMAREYFVDFPFVRALGFYGIGLIHILGNITTALTAALRIQLDAGMFASFPGFIYKKEYGRQLTNMFRIPPGSGVALDTGNLPIQQAIMPVPYKEPGGAFVNLTQNLEQLGSRVGGSAQIEIGEGKAETPVGTTLALIEQSTKVMDAVHKRLHSAQAKEFQLLKQRFLEDPESFWRHGGLIKDPPPWQKGQFLAALKDANLVPVADPNNPTSLHRIAKAVVIKTLQQSAPDLYDPIAVDTRIMRITGIDPEGLFRQTPAPPPPNPSLIAAQAKQQANQQTAQIQMMQGMLKLKLQQMQSQDKAADRESRERQEQLKIMLERLRIQEENIIHGKEAEANIHQKAMDMLLDHHRDNAQAQQEMDMKQRQHEQDIAMKANQQQADQQFKQGGMVMDLAQRHAEQQGELAMDREKHSQSMELEREKHEHALELEREKQQAELEHQRKTSHLELKHKRNMDRQDRTTKRQEILSKERIAKIGADAQIKVAKMKPKPKPAAKKD